MEDVGNLQRGGGPPERPPSYATNPFFGQLKNG